MPRRHAVALTAAVALLAAVLAIALPAQWYLSCSDPQGNELGGIDCFQYHSTPRTDFTPAQLVGFVPLVVVGGLATVTILVIAAAWAWRSADNVPRRTRR